MSKTKRIYISLPIAHYDLEERKQYAQKIEDALSHFYEVVNPLKNGIPEDADWRVHMKKDILDLLTCDKIFMCKGFEVSKGCKLELDVATSCGLGVVYEQSEYNPEDYVRV